MLDIKDILSHLSYRQACRLLGPEGERLIRRGGQLEISLQDQVILNRDFFQLDMDEAIVTISCDPMKEKQLKCVCSECNTACEHKGAALSIILEEKLALGLSAPPPERVPVESLSNEDLVEQELKDRIERANTQKMKLQSFNKNELWTDYSITNFASGKSYRVALRGWERGESYCTCPDFRKNTLGTCKHILYVIDCVRKRFNKNIQKTTFKIKNICLYLHYGTDLELRLLIPKDLDNKSMAAVRPFINRPIKDVRKLLEQVRLLEKAGHDVIIYPDAEEFISRMLYREGVKLKVEDIRKDPARHPLRKNLLKTELLPYQLDGIAFAVGAGRAVIADDMGLGKTIQGVGVAELLAQDADIAKVLIICPTSLKSQWDLEIKRFTDRPCRLIIGNAEERAAQYNSNSFYTVCNYEQVLKDIQNIEKIKWDLIILDEGQRIKNWEAKTSRVVKALKSPFALVLTGTPLENRLEELFSIVEFIDDRRLGPAFRFYNTYRVSDEKGKLLGYKNLGALRDALKPVLIRRTRKEVIKELPPRTTEIRRITPTEEQLYVHNQNKRIVSQILSKRYISEMDLLRLQKALLICRMAANSTFLVDKQAPGYSSKLEEIDMLLENLKAEKDRKIILFSEWTTMLNIIEPVLEKHKMDYVRLDGSVPQKMRLGLINRFQKEPECKVFISTNAGSTGLNLQSANTIINVDLPWNPAVLEQRIGRAHRMGQKRPVQVFLMVTTDTLEESLLETLSAKQALFLAALDPDSEDSSIDMKSGMDELKKRLEILIGLKPSEPEDERMRAQVEDEAQMLSRKQRIENAGGQLLSAAFSFIGEMFPKQEETEDVNQLAETFEKYLAGCLDKDKNGQIKMTFTLPDESAIHALAKSLAKIVNITKCHS